LVTQINWFDPTFGSFSLAGQVRWMLTQFGADALNHAGTTTHFEEADCGGCEEGCSVLVTFDDGSDPFTLTGCTTLSPNGEDGSNVATDCKESAAVMRVGVLIPVTGNLTSFSYRYNFDTTRGDNLLSYVYITRDSEGNILSEFSADVSFGAKNEWHTLTMDPYNVSGAASLEINLAVASIPNEGHIWIDNVAIICE